MAPLRPETLLLPSNEQLQIILGDKKPQKHQGEDLSEEKSSQASSGIQENLWANSWSSSNCSKSINKAELLLH